MFSTTLKNEITNAAQAFLLDNPFYSNAGKGLISPSQVACLVANIEALVQHTPKHLSLARSAALRLRDPELARYFEQKLVEEAGHDVWAKNDREKLAADFGVRPTPGISPWMERMLKRIEKTLTAQPRSYLGYILLAELFTVLTAPTLIRRLQTSCGIAPESLSVLGNHAELDKDHVSDGLREIDALLVDPIDQQEALSLIRDALDYYDRLCTDLCSDARTFLSQPSDDTVTVTRA